MSIGKQIKMHLMQNEVSQTWLSEEAKIALPKLNASLNDKRNLSAEEFASIIKALKIDANNFLGN